MKIISTTTYSGIFWVTFLLLLLVQYPVFAQYNYLVENYDTLSTIAGTGYKDDKGENGWQTSFEGKAAINAELSRPHFTMADSAGNYYIADKDAHAVRKIDVNGNITTVAGTNEAGYNGDRFGSETQLNAPNGIWVKPDGTVFILDLNNNKIRKLGLDGNITTIVDDPSGIAIGRGLWVSPDEQIIYYASNTNIKKWTSDDGISIFADGFSSLANIVIDPTGKLVATDRGANLVYRISNDGSKYIIAGNGTALGGGDGFLATETGLEGVRGIWFLQDTSCFVATHEGSQIWYIDTEGIIHLFIDGTSDDDVHFGDGRHWDDSGVKISEARAVYVDYDGNVIITENDKGYIRKVQKTTEIINIIKSKNIDKSFGIFPNPTSKNLNISFNLFYPGSVHFQILNELGELIFEKLQSYNYSGRHTFSIGENTSIVSSLENGIYFVRINFDDKIITSKFVKVQE